MTEKVRLDERDRAILCIFSENPDASQEEIARELGLRQPSVAVRLRKLRGNGYLELQAGVDPFKVGLQMAKVDVRSTEPSKILSLFSSCPYFMNGMLVSGRSNLCLFFVAEKISTLEAIVDRHLRNIPEVQDVEFNIVISSARKMVMPVRLGRGRRKTPCSSKSACGDCDERRSESCAGCPLVERVEGWFF